ncbi:hypothetical protein [Candidatus Hodarchaeum mangrovi]
MISKIFKRHLITLIALSAFLSFLVTPLSQCLFISINESIEYNNSSSLEDSQLASLEINIPLAVNQNETTTTENTTTTQTPTTTEDTNTTTTPEFKSWNSLIDEGLYYPFALLFSLLGISSTIWLIFFVETSKDRTIRERLIGTSIRLVVMAICIGLGIHFWLLFEPI